MNYWIFKSSDCKTSDGPFKAVDAYHLRMQYGIWGLKSVKDNGDRMPHIKSLMPGDKVVFYLTSGHKSFAGSATIMETILSEEDRGTLNRESIFLGVDCGVRLTDINEWEKERFIEPLLSDLKFITNREEWWTHLQGAITRLEYKDDYEVITSKENRR